MQNNNITIKKSQKIDLETFKSYYYQMNAKPDTETKVFKEHRKVTLSKIRDLIDRMSAKLENHTQFTIVWIDIIFTDKHSKSFSNYEAFNQFDWRINKIVDSLSIKWDISIVMPEYSLPQRHTVRLRFKSELKPSEYFELLTKGEDDLESIEWKAFLVCKVDFINVVLSTELINVVEGWYNCLAPIEEKWTILYFTEKYRRLFPYSTEIATIITTMALSYYALKYLNPFWIDLINTNFGLLELFAVIASLFVIYYIGKRIGQFFWWKIYETISNLEDPLVFEITDGDRNEESNNKKMNSTLLKRIYTWLIFAILASIISVLTEKLITIVI